jgi:N-acetylglucosaminyldiphosphoundecaprenol N-acetyl-beta-D-mannosaminyltransferase
MSFNTGNLLEISITLDRKKKILEEIEKYLIGGMRDGLRAMRKNRKHLVVVTPNPEQIVLAVKDKRFAKLLNEADIAIPDGIGVVWGLRTLGGSSSKHQVSEAFERIPGIEFMQDLAALAAKQGVRIGLIGGSEKLAVQALECLQKQLPGLEGEAMDAPKFQIAENQLKTDNLDQFLTETMSWIKDHKLQMVFVGLGAPKQEMLIDELARRWSLRSVSRRRSRSARDRHDLGSRDDSIPVIFMAVGGSFDILAGRIARAPKYIRTIGFEWFWRLLAEPRRFRRQLALVSFVFLILGAKIRSLAK